MKINYFPVLLIIPFLVYLKASITNGKKDDIDQVLVLSKELLIENLKLLQTEVALLTTALNGLENNCTEASIDSARSQIVRTRLAYKRVEHFMEYYDPYHVKININGAPLPKVEQKVPEIRVLEPSGLQTIDETLFLSDDLCSDAKRVQKLGIKLQHNMNLLIRSVINTEMEHSDILQSVRYQIVRIFTLGLTGFDTPGGCDALAEGMTSLEALSELLQLYLMVDQEAGAAIEQVIVHLDEWRIYLRDHNNFDTLDRLEVLTRFVNPLYSEMYDLHRKMNVEYPNEQDFTLSAHNYQSKEMFSADFLNPAYFSMVSADALNNEDRIALGRKLFYDPILSRDNKLSCVSCHKPENGFTDGLARSLSRDGKSQTLRNAPTILNAVYSTHYFLDMREHNLERQVKHVVIDENEFDTDFFTIVDKLTAEPSYDSLFRRAYPKYKLSKWSVTNALACYVASKTSFNSPFDQYVRGEVKDIAPEVRRGFNLFMGKAACGTCHFAPVFNGSVPPLYTDSESEVLGVPFQPDTVNAILDPDLGRIANNRPLDQAAHLAHAFKTVTVRNIGLTGPYMHNGVYETLEEVVDFYNRGGGAGIGINLDNQTLPPDPLDLSGSEISDLIQFMHALTDSTAIQEDLIEYSQASSN